MHKNTPVKRHALHSEKRKMKEFINNDRGEQTYEGEKKKKINYRHANTIPNQRVHCV